MNQDDLFDLDECRNAGERDLTHGLNARAQPWVLARTTLIGPVVQRGSRGNLVFFLDNEKVGLVRVEYYGDRAVVGRDLTQQGGPDLDPSAPDVSVIDSPNDDANSLAAKVADCLDVVLFRKAFM